VSTAWYPTANWWWWKASRVIGTPGPIGDYTINEFPFFSFMLGDNHPHVLALPYGLMAIGLALAILLAPRLDLLGMARAKQWSRLFGVWLAPALIFVGFFFLNTWDLPTYLTIATLACLVRVYREYGALTSEALKEVGLFILPIVGIGLVLYLPFLISFQSQANGFGFVRVRSQLHHFLIIFAPFLVMVAGFLAAKISEWRGRPADEQQAARRWAAPLVVAGLVIGAAMIALQVWTAVTTLLMASLGGVLVSLVLVAFILVALFALLAHSRADLSDVFVIILIGVGCAVALAPEWVHINDTFGGNTVRMNTVFKFLYQAWILLALASAYSLYAVVGRRVAGVRVALGLPRTVYAVCAVLLMLCGTFYPVMAFYTKANQFQGEATLDGMAYLKAGAPDEYNAIQWLSRNVKGAPVILEVVGGQYSEYGRVSAHTGLPTVLGWAGHEIQWRGDSKGWEAREGDVNRIYATTDVNEAKSLLAKYNVTYLYVGRLERDTRQADGKAKYDATALGKFATFMDVAYQQGSVTIYRTR
jgi:YYY domain-containing protein